MAYQVTCAATPEPLYVDGQYIDGGVTCPGGWSVTAVQESDFAQLVELLSFDPGVFGTLLGTCIVIFILGYSTGHVARNLGRL